MSFAKALAISALAIFLPVKSLILSAITLCLVDLVLGMLAAKKKGKKISSKGLGRTVVKIAVYEVAVCCGFLVQKYLISDMVPVVSLLGGVIGLTEMKSILENLDIIAGGSLFKNIIDRLASQSDKAGE